MKFEKGTITFKNGSYTAAMREAADVRRENKNKMMRELGHGALYAGQQWTLLSCDENGRTENESMNFFDRTPTKVDALDVLSYAIERNPELKEITVSTYNTCSYYPDQECFKDGQSEPWECGEEEDTDVLVWKRDE